MNTEAFNLNNRERHDAKFPNEVTGLMTNDRHHNHQWQVIMHPLYFLRTSIDLFVSAFCLVTISLLKFSLLYNPYSTVWLIYHSEWRAVVFHVVWSIWGLTEIRWHGICRKSLLFYCIKSFVQNIREHFLLQLRCIMLLLNLSNDSRLLQLYN